MTIPDEKVPIWRRLLKVRDERSAEMRRRMESYDREVYSPAVRAIQEECAAAGHGETEVNWNWMGVTWRQCRDCGARTEEWDNDDIKEGNPPK